MVKKTTIARDEANIRRARKAVRSGLPAYRITPLNPDALRDQWLLLYPNLLPR